MTAFQVGDRVRSTVDTQHLKRGNEYTVIAIQERRLFCGNFVTYTLRDETDGLRFNVVNGHLLLQSKAAAAAKGGA